MRDGPGGELGGETELGGGTDDSLWLSLAAACCTPASRLHCAGSISGNGVDGLFFFFLSGGDPGAGSDGSGSGLPFSCFFLLLSSFLSRDVI